MLYRLVLQDLEDAFNQLCVVKDKTTKDLQSEINRLAQENEEVKSAFLRLSMLQNFLILAYFATKTEVFSKLEFLFPY